MKTSVKDTIKRKALFLITLLLFSSGLGRVYAQTFNFEATEASAIVSGNDLYTHGFPDTLTVWCNKYTWMAE
jgi:hypothetical protein